MGADRQTMRRLKGLTGGLGLALAIVLAFNGLAWPGLALMLAALWVLSRRHGVPVLVFHSVSPDARWLPWAKNISVRPGVFAAQMQTLKHAGWQVVPDRLLFDGVAPKPRGRALALHFDDAYFDVAVFALPVLREHGFPATLFASTDFIDPSLGVRDTGRCDDIRGYLNADELRNIDSDPLFEVACHGTDHARVAISAETTPREPARWGLETAYLWSLVPGNKARWFETLPPDVTEVPKTDSTLTARALKGDGFESEADRVTRVRRMLKAGRQILCDILGRETEYLCWPFDRVTQEALADARVVGFRRFTGGRSDNRPGRPTDILSRTHIQDFAAGEAPIWVEKIVFRGRVEVAAGNLLWWPVTIAASLRRRRIARVLHGPSA